MVACRQLVLGPRTFVWGARTYVMGILNLTPDSFSGDGLAGNPTAAIDQLDQMARDGADLIDIGGQSTRPGAAPVDTATELGRVLPVLKRLVAVSPIPIAIDTDKAAVAEAALQAGAYIVNDINGLRADPAMAGVVARWRAAVVVMANLRDVAYDDVITAITAQLRRSLAIAAAAGIPREQVLVDPGFGFGPTPEENLAMVRRLAELQTLGQPILLGPSRKSTIGRVLGLPVEQRVEGTAAIVSAAIERGVDIVRVHDVRPVVRTARMTDALVRGWIAHPE